jgi:hypothetical protein
MFPFSTHLEFVISYEIQLVAEVDAGSEEAYELMSKIEFVKVSWS